MITWITVPCNSMKLWAIHCRATQDGQVMVESSDKTWSAGEGNDKWGWSGRSNTWPPDVKSQLIGKDPDTGKDWRQEGKQMTEDEMVRLHHWLTGHGFEQALGDGEGQGGLACCSPWGFQEFDTTWYWTTRKDVMGWMMSPQFSYIQVLSFPLPVLQNVTLWGDMVFKEDIKLKWGL